ncbi:MAG: hypothetical protein AB9834_09335 [Lentimicrobium sp.]
MKHYIKLIIINLVAAFLFSSATSQSVSGQEMDSTMLKKEDAFKKEKTSHSRFTKGTYFIGGDLSLNDTEGYNDFVVANIDLLDVDKTGFIMSYVAGYFISPVTSVGIRGTYKYARNEQVLEADFLNLSFNATTYQTQVLNTGFELHVFMRNYIPFGEKGNFFAFSETSVYFIKNNNYQRATRNPGNTDESISTIMAVSNGLGAGTSFGVSYFNSKHLAFEFQLGTTGLEILWKDIEKDLVDEGQSRKVTFKNGLNLLRFQVGVTYYIKNGIRFKGQ